MSLLSPRTVVLSVMLTILVSSVHAGPMPELVIISDQPTADDTVECEPQGGGNPNHPSTYWYDLTPGGLFARCDFHVQVFDPVPGNCTNVAKPTTNWQFLVHKVNDEWGASWWSPGCLEPVSDKTRFQFDNSSPATWGHWTTTVDGSSDPFAQLVDESANHAVNGDGEGYRVHVPAKAGIRFYVDENLNYVYDPGEAVPTGTGVMYLKKGSSNTVFTSTGEGGLISYSGPSVYDKFYTRVLVYSHPAVKTQRDQAKDMFDLYIDTDRVWSTGAIAHRGLSSSEVATLAAGGTIFIRMTHPVFSWNLVVALNWNADMAYIDKLKDSFRGASNYMFDVTDGHAKLGRISIRNNVAAVSTSQVWANADVRIHKGEQWPQAIVNGVTGGSGNNVYFPKYFDGNSSKQGDPDTTDYYRTMVHELGHYLFNFYDEYLDGNGNQDAFDTYRDNHHDEIPRNYGLMNSQYSTSEMSSFNDYLDAGHYTGQAANTMTKEVWEHEVGSGGSIEPCWEHFLQRFENLTGSQTLWTGYGGIRVVISQPPYGVYAPNCDSDPTDCVENRTSSDRDGPNNYFPLNFGNYANVVSECTFSSGPSAASGEEVTVTAQAGTTEEVDQSGPELLLDAELEILGDEYVLTLRVFTSEILTASPDVMVTPYYTGETPFYVTMSNTHSRLWEGDAFIGIATDGRVDVTADGPSGLTEVNSEFRLEHHVADTPNTLHASQSWLRAHLAAGTVATDAVSVTIGSGAAPMAPPSPTLVALAEPVSFSLQEDIAVGSVYVLNW